jgi:Fic-DOC domain mobile mystery protein B
MLRKRALGWIKKMEKHNYPHGATPIDDYSGLIPRWVQTLSDLNRVEAENIFSAQKKFLHKKISNPQSWFNIEYLKSIHKAMLGNVWTWAGQFRKSHTSIGIDPYLIPSRLGELCLDVHVWTQQKTDLTITEQAARIHHRLVFIHPFENGNGRFSRLISDRYLLTHGPSYPHWPPLQDNSRIRNAYIKSLQEADQGNYAPLIELMHRFSNTTKSFHHQDE